MCAPGRDGEQYGSGNRPLGKGCFPALTVVLPKKRRELVHGSGLRAGSGVRGPGSGAAACGASKQARLNADAGRCTQNTRMGQGLPHWRGSSGCGPASRSCERPCRALAHSRVLRASACIRVESCLLRRLPHWPARFSSWAGSISERRPVHSNSGSSLAAGPSPPSALPPGAAALVSDASGRRVMPANGRQHERQPAVPRPHSRVG